MKIGICQECGVKDKINIHHIDENRKNNAPGNLISLCVICHRQKHLESIRKDRGACNNKLDHTLLPEQLKRWQYAFCFPRSGLHNSYYATLMPKEVN